MKNHRWAKMLARCFKVDVGTCPKCHSDMEIVVAVHDHISIKRYLKGMGYPDDPPPIAPPRYRQDEFDYRDEEQVEEINHWKK